ncbi:MAG TPA: tyrosine-type recombinase/integrase [Sphingobium sp.]|nr:tyrosine-type recombinase/integrase [Sphingobium sp.]
MVFIRKRGHHLQAKVRIPKALEPAYGGKQFLYLKLSTTDSKAAQAQAEAWEASLRLQWLTSPASPAPSPLAGLPPAQLRQLYHDLRAQAEAGEFEVQGLGGDTVAAGIGHEIEKIAEKYEGKDDLPEPVEARLAALQDAKSSLQGLPVPRRKSLEPSFRELADDYMTTWRATHGRKVTNTEQQMLATFDLFGRFYGKKPIRGVRDPDAAHFVDALRQLDPNWARKPGAKDMTWAELQKAYGHRPKGLADATVNRHLGTLKTFWGWARRRGHCDGENPFDGHHRALRPGVNAKGYVAWSDDELRELFSPPPKRADLTELMLVALYTGMRLDEIASLTVADIHREPVSFIRVTNAKTQAGNRDVPVHRALWWLIEKAKGAPTDRLWPEWKPEGPGNKPGGDAGKEFSRFKAAKGYRERTKTFHSFRKNFVGQLERQRVPEQEVAQIVGHAKAGFTFGVYGGQAELESKAKVVALIDYPGLPVPEAYWRKER